MFFSNELICYLIKKRDNQCIIFLSYFNGWGILNLSDIFIKKNQKISLFSKQFFKNEYWNPFLYGLYSTFRIFLSFLGLGYKRFSYCFSIIFKLGFSHRLLYLSRSDVKILLNKRKKIEVFSRNLNLLNFFQNYFETVRLPNKYKQKGVFLRGTKIKLRLSSKKAKF